MRVTQAHLTRVVRVHATLPMSCTVCTMHCGMPKDTSQAEVTFSSKKIAIAIIELCLSEGVSQSN